MENNRDFYFNANLEAVDFGLDSFPANRLKRDYTVGIIPWYVHSQDQADRFVSKYLMALEDGAEQDATSLLRDMDDIPSAYKAYAFAMISDYINNK